MAGKLEEMRAQGLSEDEIQQRMQEANQKFRASGFSDAKIEAYWGADTHRKMFEETFRLNQNPSETQTYGEAFNAGLGWGVSGLAWQGKVPDKVLPEDADTLEHIMFGMGQTISDLPAAIPAMGYGAVKGAAIGAPLGPVAAGMGGFVGGGALGMAVPEAIRQTLIEAYTKDENFHIEDLMESASRVIVETGKAFAIGAISGAAGKTGGMAAGAVTKSPVVTHGAEALAAGVTATATAGAIYRELPSKEEFTAAATMALVPMVVAKGKNIRANYLTEKEIQNIERNSARFYAETGMKPVDQQMKAKKDPNFMQRMRAYWPNGMPLTDDELASLPYERLKPKPTGEENTQAETTLRFAEASAEAEFLANAEGVAVDKYVSPSGLVGRYQVNPRLAGRFGFSREDLLNPEVNKAAAQQILEDLSAKFTKPDGTPDMEAVIIAMREGNTAAIKYVMEGRSKENITPGSARAITAYEDYVAAQPPKGPKPEVELTASDEVILPEQEPKKLDVDLERKITDEALLKEKIEDFILWDKKNPTLFDKTKDTIKAAYTDFIDSQAEIGKISPEMETMFRQTYGSMGRAQHILTEGGISIDGQNSFSKAGNASLKSTFELAERFGGDKQGFLTYMVAKRMLEKAEQGVVLTKAFTVDEAKAYTALNEGKYQKAAVEFKAMWDGLMDYEIASGILNEDQKAANQQKNDFYIPWSRVMEEGVGPQLGSGKNAKVRRIWYKIGKSDRQIYSPLEAIVSRVHQRVANADKNRAMLALAEVLKSEKIPDIAIEDVMYVLDKDGKEVPFGKDTGKETKIHTDKETGEKATFEETDGERVRSSLFSKMEPNEVLFFKNGKPMKMTISDPLILKAIKGSVGAEAHALVKVLQWHSGMQRTGITAMPDYVLSMLLREPFHVSVLGEKGGVPYANYVYGFFSTMKQDAAFQDWARHGGRISVINQDVSPTFSSMTDLLQTTGVLDNVTNVVKHPIDGIRKFFEYADMVQRVGYFKRLTQKGYSKSDAAMMSRKAFLDYAQAGTNQAFNHYVRMVPFLRSTILGNEFMAKAIKERPGSVAALGVLYITIPTIAEYFINYEMDKDKDKNDPTRYQNIPWYIRDNYAVFPVGWDTKIKLRRTQQLSHIFAAPALRVLDYTLENDPQAFESFRKSFMAEFLPPMVPSLAGPVVETAFNYNLMSGQPLISEANEAVQDHLQYGAYTSETAKKIALWLSQGQVADVSPAVIESFARGWFGSIGMAALKTSDSLLMDEKGYKELATNPFWGSFFVRHANVSSQPVADFYERSKKVMEARRSYTKLLKEGNWDEAAKMLANPRTFLKEPRTVSLALSNLRQTVNLVSKSEDITNAEKRQLIDRTIRQMIDIAKAHAERENMVLEEIKKTLPERQKIELARIERLREQRRNELKTRTKSTISE